MNYKTADEFKVGDKVRILRKAESREDGWENSWVSPMNAAIGQIGIVVSLSRLRYDVSVMVQGRTFGYPSFVLELVQPITKEFKVGDRVQVKYGYGWDGIGVIKEKLIFGPFIIHFDSGKEGAFNAKYLTSIGVPSVSQQITREQKAKQTGISRAVGKHAEVFIVARKLAVEIAKRDPRRLVNADKVQDELVTLGYTSADLGNAAGALFRGKNWKYVSMKKSTRKGNHLRDIKVWQYLGA